MAPEAADNSVSMYLLCLFQVSLSSRNTARYFMQLAYFILQSFILQSITCRNARYWLPKTWQEGEKGHVNLLNHNGNQNVKVYRPIENCLVNFFQPKDAVIMTYKLI